MKKAAGAAAQNFQDTWWTVSADRAPRFVAADRCAGICLTSDARYTSPAVDPRELTRRAQSHSESTRTPSGNFSSGKPIKACLMRRTVGAVERPLQFMVFETCIICSLLGGSKRTKAPLGSPENPTRKLLSLHGEPPARNQLHATPVAGATGRPTRIPVLFTRLQTAGDFIGRACVQRSWQANLAASSPWPERRP